MIGPTHSSDYPLLMGIIGSVAVAGFLAAIFPLAELILSIGIVAAIVGAVVYMLARWTYDEYQLNKIINDPTFPTFEKEEIK